MERLDTTDREDLRWLPPSHLWPDRVYTLDEFAYPDEFNITDILLDQQVAAGRGDHPAVLYRDQSFSYAQLARAVNRFGNALRRLGVGPGDRVLLRSLNEPPALIANFAALKLGAVVVPTSPLLTRDQLVHVANDCEPAAVVVSAVLADAVLGARPLLNSAPPPVVVFDADLAWATERNCEQFDAIAAAEESELTAVPRARSAVSVLFYSSGLLEVSRATAHFQDELLVIPDDFGRRAWQVGPDDVVAGAGPMCFAGGYSTMATIAYRFGATTAIIPLGTNPEQMFATIRDYGVTLLAAMPTALAQMLAVDGADRRDLKTVRMVSAGGEPLPAPVLAGWRERFGLDIFEGFGTNGMMHVFVSTAASRQITPGSMGTPLPGYRVRIVAPDGGEAAPGELGQLFAKGPTGTLFWGHPDAAAEIEARQAATVLDGWVRIGDWVRRGPDGNVHFVARDEDLMGPVGEQFGPADIESVLAAHPAVAEAGVYSAPGPTGAVKICAIVVVAAGEGADDDLLAAVIDHGIDRLGPHQLPDEIRIVDSLPRTPFGTPLRRSLWAAWLADHSPLGPADRFRLWGREAVLAASEDPG